MRWIARKAVLAVMAALAAKLVQYFMTDTGKPGTLSRSR